MKNYKNIKDAVDSQEFYELMQIYRHSKLADQSKVIESFENVKNFIKQQNQETSTDQIIDIDRWC